MIPIVSISNMATFLVAAAITFYLWRAYLKNKEGLVKYFLCFFISATIGFFFIASPFLVFKNIFTITLAITIFPSFVYSSCGFISIVSLRILKWHKLERIYLILLLVFLIFSYLMLFINFEPLHIGYTEKFIYWYVPATRISWKVGSVASGIVSGVTLLSVTIFFFIGGLKSKKKFIRQRTILMGGGLLFLAGAGLINFIAGAVPNLSALISSSLLAVLGLFFLFLGIVMVRPKVNNR